MLIYWVWFAQLSGITLTQKLALLQQFHDPEEIYHLQGNISSIPDEVMQTLENKDLKEARKILDECSHKGIGY